MMKKPDFVAAGVVLAGILFFAQSGALAQQDRADAVFINGKVFTADARASTVQAFAMKDGRFLAVGTNEAVKRHAGSGTKVVDLKGRFVSPGLADGHFHNEGGGRGIDLSQTRNLAELLAIVGAAAKKARPGEIIASNNDWRSAAQG